MNKSVSLRKDTAAATRFSADQVDLIKRTICKGASDDELRLFLYQADRTGLDPLARQIYAVKRYDNQQSREVMSIQTSIDGFRLIAERTGKYAGQVGPFWCGNEGQWEDVWVSDGPPVAARVGVIRTDFKEPCWGVARFKSYAQTKKDGTPTRMWATMPDVMIAKCSEALALRKAFPQELSGVYTNDEMGQASSEDHPKPASPPPLKLNEPGPGEIVEPTMIEVPRGADETANWIAFGQSLIAAIKTDPERSADWLERNFANVGALKEQAPKVYERMMAAIDTATAPRDAG